MTIYCWCKHFRFYIKFGRKFLFKSIFCWNLVAKTYLIFQLVRIQRKTDFGIFKFGRRKRTLFTVFFKRTKKNKISFFFKGRKKNKISSFFKGRKKNKISVLCQGKKKEQNFKGRKKNKKGLFSFFCLRPDFWNQKTKFVDANIFDRIFETKRQSLLMQTFSIETKRKPKDNLCRCKYFRLNFETKRQPLLMQTFSYFLTWNVNLRF